MNIRILYSRDEIATGVQRLAAHIRERLGEEEPVMVLALLHGALWFAADLLRELPVCYMLETARVSSYGSGTESSGELHWKSSLPDCKGKRVLVVDDILDTGLTLEAVSARLLQQGASAVYTVVLVNQHAGRNRRIDPDFAVFELQSGYLLGYGMDWDGRYRNLPYLAELLPEDAEGGLPLPDACDRIKGV